MASLLDSLINKPAPVGDPKTAMKRLQETFRDRDYNRAVQKTKTRETMTPGEKAALERAQRDYEIARLGEPRREDRREYDGQPQSPGLPPRRTDPLAFDWSIAIGRAEKGFVRKSLAQQTITAIMAREHPASKAFFDPAHPAHTDTVANVFSVREIANSDE